MTATRYRVPGFEFSGAITTDDALPYDTQYLFTG